MPVTISSPEAAVAATPTFSASPARLGCSPVERRRSTSRGAGGSARACRSELDRHDPAGLPNPLPSKTVVLAYADTMAVPHTTEITKWLADLLVAVTDLVAVLVIGDGRVRSLSEDGPLGQELDIDLESLRDHPVIAECGRRDDVYASARSWPARCCRSPTRWRARSRMPCALQRRPRRDMRRHGLNSNSARCTCCCRGSVGARRRGCVARACRDVHVRDPLLAIILDEHAHGQVTLAHVRTRLLYAITHLPDTDAAPVAATMALIAWADGDGAVALMAADRACDLEPTNTLAPLVIHALQHGLPPNTWASLTDDIPMEVLRGR